MNSKYLIFLLIVFGLVFAEVPGHVPDWDSNCGPGFQWSGETAACEQADCPSGAGRTYTLECNCGEAWDKPFRTCYKDGLAVQCVAAGALCPDEIKSVGPTNGDTVVGDNASGSGVTVVDPSTFGKPLTPTEIANLPCNDSRRIKHDIDLVTYDYTKKVKVNPRTYTLYLFGGLRGVINNIASAVTGGWAGGEYVCGAYQGKVLDFLQEYRKQNSKLIECFDFGPIQAKGGMHQAVVVYPKGTNWLETGTIYDPWYTQSHAIYTISNWNILALGSTAPSKYYSAFPIYGNNYEDTLSTGYSPEEKAVLAYLNDPSAQNNPAVQAALAEFKSLKSVEEKKKWLSTHRNIIAGHSPANYRLVDSEGRTSGELPDGTVVDEIPGVSFLMYPVDDGTEGIYFEVPSFADFDLDFNAYTNGKTTVFMTQVDSGQSGKMYKYETEVSEGDDGHLLIPSSGSPVEKLLINDAVEVPPVEVPASEIKEQENPAIKEEEIASPSGLEQAIKDFWSKIPSCSITFIFLGAFLFASIFYKKQKP